MSFLSRYKKSTYEGFKNFTFNLEMMEQSKMKNVLLAANLEDPVYTAWIEKNIAPFNSIFKLSADEMTLVLNQITAPEKILVWAFYLSPEEEDFLKSLLPEIYAIRYSEELECTNDLSLAQHNEARRQLLCSMRKLQESRAITPAKWLFPPDEILTGNHYRPISKGPYKMLYENGKVALEGQFEKKVREGEWKHFYPNGNLLAQGIYILEEKNGEWQFFDQMGNLEQKGRYKNDSKIGDWEYWKLGEKKIINHD